MECQGQAFDVDDREICSIYQTLQDDPDILLAQQGAEVSRNKLQNPDTITCGPVVTGPVITTGLGTCATATQCSANASAASTGAGVGSIGWTSLPVACISTPQACTCASAAQQLQKLPGYASTAAAHVAPVRTGCAGQPHQVPLLPRQQGRQQRQAVHVQPMLPSRKSSAARSSSCSGDAAHPGTAYGACSGRGSYNPTLAVAAQLAVAAHPGAADIACNGRGSNDASLAVAAHSGAAYHACSGRGSNNPAPAMAAHPNSGSATGRGGAGAGGPPACVHRPSTAGAADDAAARRAAVQKRYRTKKEAEFQQLADEVERQTAVLCVLQQEQCALAAEARALEKLVSCRDEQMALIERARRSSSPHGSSSSAHGSSSSSGSAATPAGLTNQLLSSNNNSHSSNWLSLQQLPAVQNSWGLADCQLAMRSYPAAAAKGDAGVMVGSEGSWAGVTQQQQQQQQWQAAMVQEGAQQAPAGPVVGMAAAAAAAAAPVPAAGAAAWAQAPRIGPSAHEAVARCNHLQQPGYQPMSLAEATMAAQHAQQQQRQQQQQQQQEEQGEGAVPMCPSPLDDAQFAHLAHMGVDDLRRLWQEFVGRAAQLLAAAAQATSRTNKRGSAGTPPTAATATSTAAPGAQVTVSDVEGVVQEYGPPLKYAIQVKSGIMHAVMQLHLETGVPQQPPEGHWRRVLGLVALSPAQRLEAISMYHLHTRLLAKVLEERRHLTAQLAALAADHPTCTPGNVQCTLQPLAGRLAAQAISNGPFGCACGQQAQAAAAGEGAAARHLPSSTCWGSSSRRHVDPCWDNATGRGVLPPDARVGWVSGSSCAAAQATATATAHATATAPATATATATAAEAVTDDAMVVTEQLYHNLHKEASIRALTCCLFFGKLVTRLQLAQLAVASHPFLPDPLGLAQQLAEEQQEAAAAAGVTAAAAGTAAATAEP